MCKLVLFGLHVDLPGSALQFEDTVLIQVRFPRNCLAQKLSVVQTSLQEEVTTVRMLLLVPEQRTLCCSCLWFLLWILSEQQAEVRRCSCPMVRKNLLRGQTSRDSVPWPNLLPKLG